MEGHQEKFFIERPQRLTFHKKKADAAANALMRGAPKRSDFVGIRVSAGSRIDFYAVSKLADFKAILPEGFAKGNVVVAMDQGWIGPI